MNQRFKSCSILGSILCLGVYASAWDSAARAGTTVQGPAPHVGDDVSFDLYRGYLLVVRGSAGGLKDLNFLVDTGGEPSIVDLRLARKLDLPQRDAQVSVMNRTIATKSAVLPELEVGPLQINRLRVLVQDLSFLENGLQLRIDGLIGLDVLGQSSFAIDYTRKTIRFGPSPALPFSVPLFREQQYVAIDVQLNEQVFRLLVDTGASSLILFTSHMQSLLPDLEVQNVKHSTNLAGEFERAQVLLRNVAIGGVSLGQETAFLVDDQKMSGRGFDGLVSLPALGFKKVTFDFEHGTLGWTR